MRTPFHSIILSLFLVVLLIISSFFSVDAQKTNDTSTSDGQGIAETSEYIKTVDNRTLYVSALKPGRSCAIIFVHGLFGSSQHWFHQYKSWNDRCSTIVFDIYGHGLSTGILKKTDPNVLIKDIQAVLKWSKASKYILVGHNYGGVGIQQYAIQRNDPKIVALVLVDSFSRNPPPYREGGDQPIIYLLSAKDFVREDMLNAIRVLINPAQPSEIPPPGWQILAGAGVICNMVAANQIILTNHSFVNNNFQKPVFIMYGTLDSIANEDNWAEIEKSYKNPSRSAIQGGSHSTFLQYPEEFNYRLQTFVNSVRDSWLS